jgi:4-amino-4-deoxy-L-arabinose transferase-like glycosyltransferase
LNAQDARDVAREGVRLGRNRRLLLWGILLGALLLRIVPFTASHLWDETVYLQHARVIVEGRTNYNEFDYRPPLLPILYAAGYLVWDNIYVANVVQGIASTLAVLFAFLYVRRTFGSTPALIAAALFAFTPYFVEASHELMTDMPAVALMLAAMWLSDRTGSRSAFVAGIASALAAQTRFTSLFVFVYFAADSVFSGAKFRRLLWLVTGAAIAMAPYLIWVRWNYGSFFYPFAFASRITTEWTAPVPASFYFVAIAQIFPASTLALFAVGLVATAIEWSRPGPGGHGAGLISRFANLDVRTARVLALLAWGAAFFVYMLRIPHKEVRYLLPLAIPVVIVGALGAAAIWRWLSAQAVPFKVAGLFLALAVAAVDLGPAFAKLAESWIDASESQTVQIARYIREISTPADTLYAAHEFPVLAFYSERKTKSLLPIQDDFDRTWHDWMKDPGYVVYYRPSGIRETHSKNPSFKPDLSFMDARPNFRIAREFPEAIVYRYDP